MPLSAELKELLEPVPHLELPSDEEMMETLLPAKGSVVLTSAEVKPEPQEPAGMTTIEPALHLEPGAVLEPLIVTLPEPPREPKVP